MDSYSYRKGYSSGAIIHSIFVFTYLEYFPKYIFFSNVYKEYKERHVYGKYKIVSWIWMSKIWYNELFTMCL